MSGSGNRICGGDMYTSGTYYPHNNSTEGSSAFNQRYQSFDVFVGSIPHAWSEEKLWELFLPYGEIKSLEIKETDPEFKHNKKIAFVRFAREDDAKKSVEYFSGNPAGDTFLQVNMAHRAKTKERQMNGELGQGKKIYSDFKRNGPEMQGYDRNHWAPGRNDGRRGKGRQFGRSSDAEYGGGYSNNVSNTNQQNGWNSGQNYGRNSRDHSSGYHGEQRREWKYNTAGGQKRTVIREAVVLVTEVQSSVSFWGQVGIRSVAENLAKASEELQVYCPTGLKVGTSIQKNKIYGGLYPYDNLWYRCTIQEFLPKGMVKVMYVDYGNIETINQESLVELPPSLSDASPFANFYQLANCTACSDPASAQMTNPLAFEQLKNLINGKLVTVQVMSEASRGVCEVIVKHPDDPGKTVNDIMLAGGCVQRVKSIASGVIERSVAEKPLNENGESKNKKQFKQENDNLKKSIKFQCETICNLNKLFDTVRQQNEELKQELNEAFNQKVKLVLSTAENLNQSRDRCMLGDVKTKVIDDAISLVTDIANRLTLENIYAFGKVCFSSEALRSAQDLIKNCEDKEKLKELVEKRNSTRKELCIDVKVLLEEMTLLAIDQREENLNIALKKLDAFYQAVEGNEPSLEEAIANYKEWSAIQYDKVENIHKATDCASGRLAGEFGKLQKLLDPTVNFGLNECGSVDLDSSSSDFTEAVSNEIQQTQVGEDLEGISIVSTLIGALRKEIQHEISDIAQLRTSIEEYPQLQGDLERWLGNEPDILKILNVRKNLKSVKSKFRHKQADRRDLEEGDDINNEEFKKVEEDLLELRSQLHILLGEEKLALEEIAQLTAKHFPELPLLNSELNLKKYMASNGLVKQGWELTYYSHCEMTKMSSSSANFVAFQTSFNNIPCVLKEFNQEDITDVDMFESRAVEYSKLEHCNLMKLQALFYDKTNRKAFIQVPYETNLRTWLCSKPSHKSKRGILKDILEALQWLHQTGITHGTVVMENIFVDMNTRGILGEYCFVNDTQTRVSSTAEVLLKNAVPIACQASPVFDMYCLGEVACQVFLGEIPKVRDVTSLQNLSQDNGLTSMLAFLLALDGGLHPAASQVLAHPFFDETSSSKDETTEDDLAAGQNEQEDKPSETIEEENEGNGVREAEEKGEKEGEKEQVIEHKEGSSEETADVLGESEDENKEQTEGANSLVDDEQPAPEVNTIPDEKPAPLEEEHDEKPTDIVPDDKPTDIVPDDKPTDIVPDDKPTDIVPDDKPTDIVPDDKEIENEKEDVKHPGNEGVSGKEDGQLVEQAKIPDDVVIRDQPNLDGEKQE